MSPPKLWAFCRLKYQLKSTVVIGTWKPIASVFSSTAWAAATSSSVVLGISLTPACSSRSRFTNITVLPMMIGTPYSLPS